MAFETEAVQPGDQPLFILKRRFAAPRALAYRCFMDPTHLSRWWGPRGMSCTVCEIDPRVGGAFRIGIRAPNGTDYDMRGVFRTLDPDRRIVKDDDVGAHPEEWFDMMDPEHKGQYPRKLGLLTSISFDDHAPGTLVTIETRFDSIGVRDNFVRLGFKDGWNSSLERLDDLVEALKGNDREISITRLVNHPVDRVFAAFSNPAGMATWWGPNGFTTTTKAMQFKVGGVWDYVMHGPDGTDYPNYVSYTTIEKNALIAYDHGTDADHPAMFKAEIRFDAEGSSTRVTLKLTLKDAAERPHYIKFGAVEGGYQNLERLEKWLTGNPPSNPGDRT